MGQKVNPHGMRLGINKTWDSKWYANNNDFSKLLEKDIKIRRFLEKRLDPTGISKVEIERNTKRTEVIIHTSKPGIIIGRGGEEIEKLKKELSNLTSEFVQISIADVKKPDVDAQLVAQSIASQIENRASFRMAQKRAIRNAMKNGVKGIKTLVSGRLNGADIARGEGYTEGTIPLHTLRADIDYATAEADTTYGKIGVKVWIYKGEILTSNKTRNIRNDRNSNKERNNSKASNAKGGN